MRQAYVLIQKHKAGLARELFSLKEAGRETHKERERWIGTERESERETERETGRECVCL
jgi:hypothetical protein